MKTLYDEIRKYIFLFQIFGLCPFGRNEFQNYILGLYSLLIFVVLVVSVIIAVFDEIINDNNSISAMVGGLVFLGETSTHVIVIFQAFISRFDLKNILDEIDNIDEIFREKLHRPIDYTTLRKKYFSKFTFIILLSKGLLVFLLVFLSLGSRNSAWRFWLQVSFSIAVIHMRCVQNIFFVDLLRERLEFLNQKLLEISQQHSTKKSKLILYVDAYDTKSRTTNAVPIREEYDELLALKQIYGMIWNTTSILNDCFGWSILAYATRSFIGFTSHGYWLFLAFEAIIDSEYIVDSGINFILIAFLLSILCSSCYTCTGCAEETGGILNKIEERDNNEPFNFLIREFSLQILHEPIIISANGFFTVNLDLLGSLAASTVTYLVILIQFQLSEKEKQTNITNNSTINISFTGNNT